MTKPKKKQTDCKPRFRIMQGEQIALGPGKVDLLEAIERSGSISQAARELGLSYRRAWMLVDTMNQCFKTPLVAPARGGKKGGGAQVTALGLRIAKLYRTMETKAVQSADKEWRTIQKSLKKDH